MSVSLTVHRGPSDAPWASWASVNARAVLAAMGVADPYLCGSLAPDEIPAAVRRVIWALNVPSARASMVRAASGGERFAVGGSDDAAAQRRLREALEVLRYACERGHTVAWS